MDEFEIERRFEEIERELRVIKNQNNFLIREIESRNIIIRKLLIKLKRIQEGEKK